MNKEKFKEEIRMELFLFSTIANRDSEKGFTDNQVLDGFVKYVSLFYDARIDYDVFAEEKKEFVRKYASDILNGRLETLLDRLCNSIENSNKVRGK